MRKIILTAICCLLFSLFVSAQQNDQIALQILNHRLPALIEQEDFDEVVIVAEKIVKIEKQGGMQNLSNYAAALMNLALWKKQRLARKPQIKLVESETESIRVFLKESGEIEAMFRELLAIFQNNLNDPPRLAAAQGELANFLFDWYTSRDKISEAEALYEQSLELRAKHFGTDAESTLSTMLQLSDFYFQSGEFEKFLPLYRKLTSTITTKYGEKDSRLLPAWRLYVWFLITTDRETEARAFLKQVSGISGEQIVLPIANYQLFNRAAEDIDNVIGTPRITYTDSSPIVMPNPMDVRRNRPGAGGTYDRPQTTTGMIVNGRLQLATSISRPNNILVNVLIDESGSIIEANPVVASEKVKKEIAKKVSAWKFRPLIEDGAAKKMRGVVNLYYYKSISGSK